MNASTAVEQLRDDILKDGFFASRTSESINLANSINKRTQNVLDGLPAVTQVSGRAKGNPFAKEDASGQPEKKKAGRPPKNKTK